MFEEAAEQEEQMINLHLVLMSRNFDCESSGEGTLDPILVTLDPILVQAHVLDEWPFCAVVPVLAAALC